MLAVVLMGTIDAPTVLTVLIGNTLPAVSVLGGIAAGRVRHTMD